MITKAINYRKYICSIQPVEADMKHIVLFNTAKDKVEISITTMHVDKHLKEFNRSIGEDNITLKHIPSLHTNVSVVKPKFKTVSEAKKLPTPTQRIKLEVIRLIDKYNVGVTPKFTTGLGELTIDLIGVDSPEGMNVIIYNHEKQKYTYIHNNKKVMVRHILEDIFK